MIKLLNIAFFCCFLLACQQDKKLGVPAKVEVTQGISTIYVVDKKESKSEWNMTMNDALLSFIVPISSGRFSVLDAVVTTGDFELDMTDFQAVNTKKVSIPLDTLRDTTAFDTKQFTLARFIIKKIETKQDAFGNTHSLDADFILKNKTVSLNVPAQISLNDNTILLKINNLALPLSEWGIWNQAKKKNCQIQLQVAAKKE